MTAISIGVPFYNCRDTLPDTIRSVFAQTFKDWELILVDDGSTDGSVEIASAVADSRVKVVCDRRNRGIGTRRAQIVDLVNGRYLAWLDADDLMHPKRLEVQYSFLEQNTSIDLVDTWTYFIDPNNRITGLWRIDGNRFTPEEAVKRPLLCNPATLGRIDVYREHPFDRNLRRVEDWDFWVRAIGNNMFAHIPEALCYKRNSDIDALLLIRKESREALFIIKVILRYGPHILGWGKTLLLITRYSARPIVRGTMSGLGLQGLFKATLRSAISEHEREEGKAGLECIFSTAVPGLDPPSFRGDLLSSRPSG